MLRTDFEKYGITKFTWKEIESTGANPADVQLVLMMKLQVFRLKVNTRVVLLVNGLTTGTHKSKEHKDGLAVDIAFQDIKYLVNVSHIVNCALEAGFKGIGVYHNEAAYSFHFDCRENYSFWSAFKRHRENTWNYRSLIVDPKDFFTKENL